MTGAPRSGFLHGSHPDFLHGDYRFDSPVVAKPGDPCSHPIIPVLGSTYSITYEPFTDSMVEEDFCILIKMDTQRILVGT